jgi:two-component system cell cycle sensor histidine kinase/response regulator CckA
MGKLLLREQEWEMVGKDPYLIADHVQDIVCHLDKQGIVRYVNLSFQKTLGYAPENFIGKSYRAFIDLLHPDDASRARTHDDQTLSRGVVHAIEYRCRHAEGHYVTLQGINSPIYDEQGRFLGKVISARDVTAQKRFDETLQYQANLLENVSDAIIATDLNRCIQSWNRAAERLYGWQASEVIGKHFDSVMNSSYLDGRSEEDVLKATTEKGYWKGSAIHRRRDGSIIIVDVSVAMLKDKDGNAIGRVGLNQDITERRRAEEALRQSERDYRGLFEQAHDAILILDPADGIVLDCNQRACTLYGFERSEFVGMNINKFTKNLGQARKHIQKTLKAGSINGIECVHLRKDGTEMPLEINASTIEYMGRRAILSINRDVSAWKRLQHAERLATVGRLSASIAHELNNPLQAIQGALALVQEDPATVGRIKTYVDIAQAEILRIGRVVNQMREMYRPSSGNKCKVSFNAEIEALLPLIRKQREDQGVKLILHLATDLPRAWGVADQIRQVLLNLLLNALDAMPQGGQLELTTCADDKTHTVIAKVRDTGPGISDEDLPHLFTPFFTTKANGMGLGLFISNDIIKQHGGKLEIISQPGEGTVCQIVLPYDESTPEADSEP